jgi:phosphoribosylcarboxyaminoimidazole (NCAIR) mutase
MGDRDLVALRVLQSQRVVYQLDGVPIGVLNIGRVAAAILAASVIGATGSRLASRPGVIRDTQPI